MASVPPGVRPAAGSAVSSRLRVRCPLDVGMPLGGRDALHLITVQDDGATSKARQDLQIVTDDHRHAEVGSATVGLDDVKSTEEGHSPLSRKDSFGLDGVSLDDT